MNADYTKRIILLVSFTVLSIRLLYSLSIAAGTYYFDNSKTQYTHIQFLYGTDNPATYTLINLTHKGENIWELAISANVNNVYRYCFCASQLETGTFYDKGFSEMKEYLSKTLIVNRTATTEANMIVEGTYTPTSGDNWAQGGWLISGEKATSGTLPVFYLNTENSAEITSKDYYINATFYIDAGNIEDYNSVGSKENPVTTEVRGRGNYTWKGFDKKPYRLKMAKKASLLNMTTDKSYNLLAHADDITFLRNEVGFELSRRLNMKYTPVQEPVELIKNGDYCGLYFLTDHIKISPERVNITEQNDNETDPELITGGWLLEIDNYEDNNQIATYRVPRFTCKSPDSMSSVQETYIQNFLQLTEAAIYINDKTNNRWENFIDLHTFVDFYIIQEIMGNTESFNGSCFFSKDRGSDAKLHFGPVWDFGNAYRHGHKFIYQDIWFASHWLPEIVEYPHFQETVSRRWTELQKENFMEDIYNYIDEFAARISQATNYNYNRWPQYGSSNYNNEVKTVKNYLTDRVNWLNSQWYNDTFIAENNADKIDIYPNPTQGTLFLTSPNKLIEARLFSFTGTLLQTFTNASESIELNVSNGTYILQLVTEQETVSKLVIKK